MPQKKNIFFKRRLFWILIGVPNLISLLYFGVIATPEYVSRSSFVVYRANQGEASHSISAQLNVESGGVPLEGDYLVSHYVHSWRGFTQQHPGHLKTAWRKGDFVSRFGGLLGLFQTSQTALWRYYRNHVVTKIDKDSAILTVSVIGYQSDFVQQLNRSILHDANVTVNAMDNEAFEQGEAFFGNQVEQAKQQLRRDVAQLSTIQKNLRVLDPGTDYQARLNLLDHLIEQRVGLEAHQAVISGAAPGSRQGTALAAEIRTLDRHISQLETALYGGSPQSLTQASGMYTYWQALIQNDEATLRAGEMQLLNAQQAVLQNRYSMSFVQRPSVAPEPTRPRRLAWVAGIFLVTLFLYAIVK